jgi:hypothetical protein
MIIEFHYLDIVENKFEEILELLLSIFFIAHIHANNFDGLINNAIPKTLEITFINKKLVQTPVLLSQRKYPIEGLDSPNNHKLDDIELDFSQGIKNDVSTAF